MHVIGHHNVMPNAPAIDHRRFFPDLAQDFVALRVGEQLFSLARASGQENDRAITERRNMRQMSMLSGWVVQLFYPERPEGRPAPESVVKLFLLFLAELFEVRIAAQWIEHWIEPEQRGSERRSGECAKVGCRE